VFVIDDSFTVLPVNSMLHTMSGPIAFRFDDDEVEAEYDEYRESLEGDPSKSDVARELIDAGLAARHRDVFDHVGTDEELREAVEEARNVEETDAEAIRRLLRIGVVAAGPTERSPRDRLLTAVGGVGIAGVTALTFWYAGPVGAALAVVLWGVIFAFGDLVADAVGRFESWAVDALTDEADRNRSR
jgi:hypothetical protein